MQETLLQYIWQFQLYNTKQLQTTEGEQIQVLDRGKINPYSGPDFTNARILIGDTQWAGNIELHIKTSDWFSHQHHHQRTYNNVILHVVYQHDTTKLNLPTLQLQDRIANHLLERYERLMTTHDYIACNSQLQTIPDIQLQHWKHRLLIERLENKTERILKEIRIAKQNLNQVFYEQLAYNFGLTSNSDQMLQLAKRIPLTIIQKYRHTELSVYAILFGVAGFLNQSFIEEYPNQLKKEYLFLKQKHKLKELKPIIWNFAKVRPIAFPTIRIAQLGALLLKSYGLFSTVMTPLTLKEIKPLFNIQLPDYWQTHYQFNSSSSFRQKKISKQFLTSILLNTILPFQFIVGKLKDNEALKEHAITMYEQLPKERNFITKKWENIGVKIPNASVSQAFIHLYKNYCLKKQCLNCKIGFHILSK